MIRRFLTLENFTTIILAIIIIVMIIMVANKSQTLEHVLLAGLIAVTTWYAYSTIKIAKAAKRQADASMKMAEEMRKQTIMSSRPWIIQKAIHEDEKQIRPIEDSFNPNYFSHFEIYNAGNGPAIELEISLRDRLDREGTGLDSHRETFLLAGKTLEFPPFNVASLDESKTYYLACEYQSVLSLGLKTWYQTLLPFKPVKSGKQGKIYVNPDKLEFKDDVPEDERINAFGWRSKPK